MAQRSGPPALDVAELSLVGLVGIGDPPRANAPAVVSALRRAGIRLLVLTGDHRTTAESVAQRVGIGSGQGVLALDATELESGVVTDPRVCVVARVQPEQKMGIVGELQDAGDVVAMVGDGVNDAPALRGADIGVAAGGRGREVAKQAADLVLVDDDLSTVVAAVEEGRRIMRNIGSFLVFALSGGAAEIGVMLLGPAIGMVLPLLPAQILWINLLTHGLTGIAFGAEPAEPADMQRAPVPPAASILSRRARWRLAVAAASLTAASLVSGAVTQGPLPERRSVVFLALGLGQLGVAVAMRARVRHRRLHDRGLDGAVVAGVALMVGAVTLAPLQRVFATATPDLHALLVSLVAGVVPGVALWLAGTADRTTPSEHEVAQAE